MDNNHESIQTEKPVPPWERPGCFRLDCEPHRGNLLWWTGIAGAFVGCYSVCLLCAPIASPFLTSAGLLLGSTTRHFALHDLRLMERGWIDRRGRRKTADGLRGSLIALVSSWLGLVLWAVLIWGTR